MRVEEYKCDHCGKKLNEMHDYVDCEIDMEVCIIDADLCQECAEELKKMVASFLNKEGNKT